MYNSNTLQKEKASSTNSIAPLKRYPNKLFVEVTSRCNLKCFMCVKQQQSDEMDDGDLTPELFARLEPAFPHIDALILNGIGEPLLNNQLDSFIRRARRAMGKRGWIGFQSNGLLLTKERAISLLESGLDRICLSVDASSPSTFERVREGGELEGVEKAFLALKEAKKKCNRPEFKTGIEFVLMKSNINELSATLRWCAKLGASFAIVTHLLPYNDQHSEEAAYTTCSAQSIELFKAYRAKCEKLDLDIYNYMEARWKYNRNSKEQLLVNLIEEMRKEAEQKQLFFDMKQLLQLDLNLEEEVKSVFRDAAMVAKEVGITLSLPEITLQEDRHCGFVEDGGAFVSWDGNVSPCYFLWHRFNCYSSGWQQYIKPRVFGNLQQKNIVDIWNSEPYKSFRKQVITYDYPVCSSCTLSPCDYVQTDEFVQDCHVKDIPCGSCLWCMGIFQCLK